MLAPPAMGQPPPPVGGAPDLREGGMGRRYHRLIFAAINPKRMEFTYVEPPRQPRGRELYTRGYYRAPGEMYYNELKIEKEIIIHL